MDNYRTGCSLRVILTYRDIPQTWCVFISLARSKLAIPTWPTPTNAIVKYFAHPPDKGPGIMLETSGPKIDLSSGRSNWCIGYLHIRRGRFTILPLLRLACFKPGFVAVRKSTAAFNRDYA